MPHVAAGSGGPAILVDSTGTPYDAENPFPVSGAPGGEATIADGADVAQGAIADAIATAGSTGTVSAKLRRVTGTLGATNDAKVVDPDAATATMIQLLRGCLSVLIEIRDGA